MIEGFGKVKHRVMDFSNKSAKDNTQHAVQKRNIRSVRKFVWSNSDLTVDEILWEESESEVSYGEEVQTVNLNDNE